MQTTQRDGFEPLLVVNRRTELMGFFVALLLLAAPRYRLHGLYFLHHQCRKLQSQRLFAEKEEEENAGTMTGNQIEFRENCTV